MCNSFLGQQYFILYDHTIFYNLMRISWNILYNTRWTEWYQDLDRKQDWKKNL